MMGREGGDRVAMRGEKRGRVRVKKGRKEDVKVEMRHDGERGE